MANGPGFPKEQPSKLGFRARYWEGGAPNVFDPSNIRGQSGNDGKVSNKRLYRKAMKQVH